MKKTNTTFIHFPNGDVHRDPFSRKYKNDRFFDSLLKDGNVNYNHYSKLISPEASELVVKYLLDMRYGKNLAKGKKPLASNTLFNYQTRLPKLIQMLETYNKKPLLELEEDEVLSIFRHMQEGIIKTKAGNPYQDTRTSAKFVSAFWRWHMRICEEEGKPCKNLVKHVDLSRGDKPKWNYFTFDHAKEMSERAMSLYYKALVLFLFDSGIRPPKELMNVRVKDITPVPDSENVFLQIREETSKTFGRKIKLMISSEAVKRYIKDSNKKPDDFLFHYTYQSMNTQIKKLGFAVLGVGEKNKNKHNQSKVIKGISMYDFRHCSVCHYLPIYSSENQMKYRYGWKRAEMIHYYSEFLGMEDKISDNDMISQDKRFNMQIDLEREKQKVNLLQEQLLAQRQEMDEKMQRLEAMMLKKFVEGF